MVVFVDPKDGKYVGRGSILYLPYATCQEANSPSPNANPSPPTLPHTGIQDQSFKRQYPLPDMPRIVLLCIVFFYVVSVLVVLPRSG